MSLFECPECGNQVSDKAEACPRCGHPIEGRAAQSDSDDSLAAAPENGRCDKPVNKRNPRTWLYVAGAILLASCIFGVLYSTHIICFHNWQEANCIQPKKCHICKRTVGEKNPDSHWWEPASCSKPKHCRNCGKKVGKKDPKAHRWVNASCVEPKHCTECGKTAGDAIPNKHRLSEQEDGSYICLNCGRSFGSDDESGNQSDNPTQGPADAMQQENAVTSRGTNTKEDIGVSGMYRSERTFQKYDLVPGTTTMVGDPLEVYSYIAVDGFEIGATTLVAEGAIAPMTKEKVVERSKKNRFDCNVYANDDANGSYHCSIGYTDAITGDGHKIEFDISIDGENIVIDNLESDEDAGGQTLIEGTYIKIE